MIDYTCGTSLKIEKKLKISRRGLPIGRVNKVFLFPAVVVPLISWSFGPGRVLRWISSRDFFISILRIPNDLVEELKNVNIQPYWIPNLSELRNEETIFKKENTSLFVGFSWSFF